MDLLSVVDKLLNYFEVGKGNILYDQVKSCTELSDASLKVIERALLNEVDSFYEVLRDTYLQMHFLS